MIGEDEEDELGMVSLVFLGWLLLFRRHIQVYVENPHRVSKEKVHANETHTHRSNSNDKRQATRTQKPDRPAHDVTQQTRVFDSNQMGITGATVIAGR